MRAIVTSKGGELNRRRFIQHAPSLGGLAAFFGFRQSAQTTGVCPAPAPALAGGRMVAEFESNGPGVSERFELEAGLAIIHLRSSLNDEHCEVLLYPAPPDVAMSTQTPQIIFDGYFGPAGDRTWATTVIAGTYLLTVTGRGNWLASVEQ